MGPVEQYITEEFARKGWPFFSAVEIINKFGEDGRDELNRMRTDGKIRRRKYINGPLVEIINNRRQHDEQESFSITEQIEEF